MSLKSNVWYEEKNQAEKPKDVFQLSENFTVSQLSFLGACYSQADSLVQMTAYEWMTVVDCWVDKQ